MRSLTADGFERVLLEARALGIARVVLTGGEPLIHEDLNAVVDHVLKIGVDVEVVATGYRLEQREPALKRLGKRLTKVWTEFLGGTAATHERMNGRPGSFQEARGVLECANELGVRCAARLIPTPEALREVDGWKAAVARFQPELVVDRASSHLPRSACELRSSTERCSDRDGDMVAAVAASGRVFPCLASIGARALDEADAPLLEVRMRETLKLLAGAPRGTRCGACPDHFIQGIGRVGVV
jgi:hypothetical protein